MNEIPELKADYAFLKKFDARRKVWREIDAKKTNRGKQRLCSNFLLHPKQLSSESEDCSSVPDSPPQKLFSDVLVKDASLDESNNNLVPKYVLTEACRIIVEQVETKIGNTEAVNNEKSVANSNVSNVCVKKSQKCRPSPSSARLENFDRKYTTVVEKSLKLLSSIQELIIKGIAPPDGEEDYARRTKRVQEFSARFSRIYLYPLIRQMDELSVPGKLTPGMIDQKILYAHQMIFQGLQAYYNHLPSSVGKCCSDKLKSLLDQAVYLCQLYGLLKTDGSIDNNEFVNIMLTQTELLIETINTFDKKILEQSRKSIESVATKKVKPHAKKMRPKLSMYGVTASFRRDPEWKIAFEALAKKKFSVKSKYKTASFKHRPPVEKPHIISLPSNVKLFQKKSSGVLKSTPRVTPIREDDIKTMVEMESEVPAPPNSGKAVNHENSIASNHQQQLVRDSDREEIEDGSVNQAVEVLRRFLENSTEGQAQILEQIVNRVEEKQPDGEKAKKKLKEPTVTITGAKNAKLICIRDDNSVIEADDNKIDKEIMTDAEIKLKSSETQTDLGQDDQVKSKSAIKISRLPKTSRTTLQLLPKEYAINIIQYKLRYSHFHKHNPMYRKAANVQPWVLMGRISDDILDHILQSVTRELEVNEILENLYNAEFQY